MSLETFTELCYFLVGNSGQDDEISIWFFGKEPLMNFQLIEAGVPVAKRIAKQAGKTIHFGITTNVTLITEDVNAFLKEHDFGLLLSIDGGKASHDLHRKTKVGDGSWDLAIAGLKRVLAWKKPQIRWTVTPETLDSIVEDIGYFIDLGINAIALEPVFEVEWKPEDLSRYEAVLEALIPIYAEQMRKGNEDFSLKPFEDGFQLMKLSKRENDRCGLGKGSIGVGTDGVLYPCHRYVGRGQDYMIGDVRSGLNVAKIKARLVKWNVTRVKSKDGRDCLACPARVMCNGGCLAVNEDVNGDMLVQPSVVCDITWIKAKAAYKLWCIMKAEDNRTFEKKWSKDTRFLKNPLDRKHQASGKGPGPSERTSQDPDFRTSLS